MTTDIAHLSDEELLQSDSLFTKAMRRLRRDKLTMLALAIITILALVTLFAPFITGSIMNIDPNDTDPRNNFLPPGSPGHLLGTDDLGRDQLARLLHAGGVSLGIGFFGAILSLSVGLTVGTATGYFGGRVDDIVTWIITTVDSIPTLYLLILFSAIFSPSAESLIIVVAVVGWTSTTRLVRGQTFAIRGQEYVLAAEAVGAKPLRIMFSHILPNLISVSVVQLAISIATLILAESSLSFLGLGVQPPQATWGNMLSKSQQFFRLGGHLVFFPGVMIFITVLCFYIVGDGIRDAFDPTVND